MKVAALNLKLAKTAPGQAERWQRGRQLYQRPATASCVGSQRDCLEGRALLLRAAEWTYFLFG